MLNSRFAGKGPAVPWDIASLCFIVMEIRADISLTEAIDTTMVAGRMMMQMVGSFAEFERAMIRERTTTGLAQARAEGRVGGRRRKLDPKKRREIAGSDLSGRKSGAEMARLYDISEPTVSRIVAEPRQNLEKSHADQP